MLRIIYTGAWKAGRFIKIIIKMSDKSITVITELILLYYSNNIKEYKIQNSQTYKMIQ